MTEHLKEPLSAELLRHLQELNLTPDAASQFCFVNLEVGKGFIIRNANFHDDRANWIRGISIMLVPSSLTSPRGTFPAHTAIEGIREFLRNQNYPVDQILRVKRLKALID